MIFFGVLAPYVNLLPFQGLLLGTLVVSVVSNISNTGTAIKRDRPAVLLDGIEVRQLTLGYNATSRGEQV